MGYNLRCRDCTRRFTLRKHPIEYVRTPKCPWCGSLNWRDVNATEKARNARRVCNCMGWTHPHHRGAIYDVYRICIHADHDRVNEMLDEQGC